MSKRDEWVYYVLPYGDATYELISDSVERFRGTLRHSITTPDEVILKFSGNSKLNPDLDRYNSYTHSQVVALIETNSAHWEDEEKEEDRGGDKAGAGVKR